MVGMTRLWQDTGCYFISMQPYYSHARRPVSTLAFRDHVAKKRYKSTPCVPHGREKEKAHALPAPYLQKECGSYASEYENSCE
jgi:hypothetical protein